MALVHTLLATLRRDEEGQGLAEYALILALIAIVAIIALIFLGQPGYLGVNVMNLDPASALAKQLNLTSGVLVVELGPGVDRDRRVDRVEIRRDDHQLPKPWLPEVLGEPLADGPRHALILADGDPLTLQWAFTLRPANSSATLAGASATVSSATLPAAVPRAASLIAVAIACPADMMVRHMASQTSMNESGPEARPPPESRASSSRCISSPGPRACSPNRTSRPRCCGRRRGPSRSGRCIR